MTNAEELKKAIAEAGIKLNIICKKCDITYATLRRKIANKSEFKSSEIDAITQLCHLNAEQRDAIFFCNRG